MTQSLEDLQALIDELHSRLVLVEDSHLASPGPSGQGCPEGPTPARRPEDRTSPSAEQLGALAHFSAELNGTRRRARDMERTMAERLPDAPSRGPSGAVPPGAAAPQGWRPTGVYPSRGAEERRPPMDANVASETQALPPAPGSRWQTGQVPYRDDPDRGGAARGSGEPMFSVDPRWGSYPPENFAVHPGPVDVRTLPVTPFGTLVPAKPGLEPVHTMIQEFSAVADDRMYCLDNTSRLVTSGDAGRIAKYVQHCRGILRTMRSFDGTDPIQLLPFLKDIWITFNSQHLTEGVAVRVLAHFLERDRERLYTSYTMRGLRPGQLHDDVSWPGLVNQFLKRYLTDDVLGEAYDAVATARQQSHEMKSTFADRLDTAAFRCTAVFSEQSLAHYFVRGLAPATRAAVSETVQPLQSRQKTDLPTNPRIATAEGTTYRARCGLPLPDSKPAGRAGRTTKSAETRSPASTLHIEEDEWQADPVFNTQGAGPVGGRPPSRMSTGTTSSYATAFAATPKGARSTDPQSSTSRTETQEAKLLPFPSSPTRRRVMRQLSPQRIAARTCAGYAIRTDTPFTRARSCRRNNVCSRRTGITATRWRRAPGRRNSSGKRSARADPCVKDSRIVRVGCTFRPPRWRVPTERTRSS